MSGKGRLKLLPEGQLVVGLVLVRLVVALEVEKTALEASMLPQSSEESFSRLAVHRLTGLIGHLHGLQHYLNLQRTLIRRR